MEGRRYLRMTDPENKAGAQSDLQNVAELTPSNCERPMGDPHVKATTKSAGLQIGFGTDV